MHWYCIVEVPRKTLHRELHALLTNIPAPSGANAKGALEQLAMLEKYGAIRRDDPLDKRLAILAALFDCCEQPTADAFRKQQFFVELYYKFFPRPYLALPGPTT